MYKNKKNKESCKSKPMSNILPLAAAAMSGGAHRTNHFAAETTRTLWTFLT